MFCPQCGAQSGPDNKFCERCGASLGAGNPPGLAAGAPVPAANAFPQAPTAQAVSRVPPAPAPYPPPLAYPPYPQYAQMAPPRKSSSFVVVIILIVLGGLGYAVYHYVQNGKKGDQSQNQNQNQPGGTVTIGTKDQVVYSGLATQDQATALGNALKSEGYFQDLGVTVLLNKQTSGTTISFVVKDNAWNQPGTMATFDEIVREVASSVGGLPVQVQLDNSAETVEKSSIVGSANFGKDTVVYEGVATQAAAQALGEKLQSDGYFTGRGVDVILSKHPNGTTIAFILANGVWNNPDTVTGYENLVRDVAPTVGGLPIKMLLLSNTLQKEKDETIN